MHYITAHDIGTTHLFRWGRVYPSDGIVERTVLGRVTSDNDHVAPTVAEAVAALALNALKEHTGVDYRLKGVHLITQRQNYMYPECSLYFVDLDVADAGGAVRYARY
jgi:hypothetical protein